MEDVVKVASYIVSRYQKEYGSSMDEMKLHKLLYFTQRESIIQTGSPLFETAFEAWKYGPVLVEIRRYYKNNLLNVELPAEKIEQYQPVFDKVFQQYASKDSWSLSTITHGEYSWQNARKGVSAKENSSNKIQIEDIRKDAERIRLRRFILRKMKTLDGK